MSCHDLLTIDQSHLVKIFTFEKSVAVLAYQVLFKKKTVVSYIHIFRLKLISQDM